MEVAHRRAGSGDAVYLVAGLGQTGERWHRVADRLAADHAVVTLDNRETGATGPSTGDFTLADLATDVLDLAASLGDERFFLAGISMGGMIAQEVVRLGGDRVRAAAFLATHGGTPGSVPPPDIAAVFGRFGGPPPATDEERLQRSADGWASLAGAEFVAANPDVVREEGELGLRAATPPQAYMRQMQAISQFDPGDSLVGSPVPFVVMHGDADPLVPYENGVRLSSKLGCELVTFDGSGHWLEVERAAEVADVLRDHFAKAAAQGR